MEIKDLIKLSHENSAGKGFWDSTLNIGEKLMLIVSELAEALEADRNNNYGIEQKDTFEDEIADVFIRLGDLCGGMDIDIEKQIVWKLGYNSKRKKLHGKKY